MKFSSQEEYGLRLLLRLARAYDEGKSLTIPEISRAEGISEANTAKILRVLRLGGLLESERGNVGGYSLTKPPEEIYVSEILTILGGKLFNADFCKLYSGNKKICVNSSDCSIRSLWRIIQEAVDNITQKITLRDLQIPEHEISKKFPIEIVCA